MTSPTPNIVTSTNGTEIQVDLDGPIAAFIALLHQHNIPPSDLPEFLAGCLVMSFQFNFPDQEARQQSWDLFNTHVQSLLFKFHEVAEFAATEHARRH